MATGLSYWQKHCLETFKLYALLLTTWSNITLWSRLPSRAIVPFRPNWASYSRHPCWPCSSRNTCKQKKQRNVKLVQGSGGVSKKESSPGIHSVLRRAWTSAGTHLGPAVNQKTDVCILILRKKAFQRRVSSPDKKAIFQYLPVSMEFSLFIQIHGESIVISEMEQTLIICPF